VLRHIAAGLWVAVQRVFIAIHFVLTGMKVLPAMSDAVRVALFGHFGFAAALLCVAGMEVQLWAERRRGNQKQQRKAA
jgi:hypothetical protein